MIAGISEKQLADHCAGKGDRIHIRLGGRVSVLGAVEAAENGVDLTDDSVRTGNISIESEAIETCAQGYLQGGESEETAYPFR